MYSKCKKKRLCVTRRIESHTYIKVMRSFPLPQNETYDALLLTRPDLHVKTQRCIDYYPNHVHDVQKVLWLSRIFTP